MIVGDFTGTKKMTSRETYSIEFDPKELNRAQRRAFAGYVRREIIGPEQRRLRKRQMIDLRGLWCPRCRLPFLSLRIEKAPVFRCQCKAQIQARSRSGETEELTPA